MLCQQKRHDDRGTFRGWQPSVAEAWIAENVPQCGYCQSGQIMSAADLLKQKPKPTRNKIVEHMSTNICRCSTYPRIVRAILRAWEEALNDASEPDDLGRP